MILRATERKLVRLRLSRDLRRVIRRGHPWVFRDALRGVPDDAEAGDVALLFDARGKPLAKGYVDPDGPLALRVASLAPRDPLDDAWAEAGFTRALALRRRLFADTATTGYRLFNGEGDGLPGLVVDRYADVAVVRADGPVAERFWDARGVGDWLVANTGVRTVYQRHRRRGEAAGGALVGPPPDAPVHFTENGLRFTADVVHGQKTGFYLDQRDNRARLRALARGASVLNVFAYTGGFSVAAGVGGAARVTTVDRAAPAVAESVRHWALNDLDPAAHEGVTADAFDFLDQAVADERRWDVVVLDPPAFAPSKDSRSRAVAAYTRLVAAGAAVTAPGGLLLAASCSAHVDLSAFTDLVEAGVGKARRRGVVLGVHGQPADHPAPLPCPELRYLKSVFTRLDG